MSPLGLVNFLEARFSQGGSFEDCGRRLVSWDDANGYAVTWLTNRLGGEQTLSPLSRFVQDDLAFSLKWLHELTPDRDDPQELWIVNERSLMGKRDMLTGALTELREALSADQSARREGQ